MAKDIRKIPFSQSYSLGDLMGRIEICKELDRKDKEKEYFTEDEFNIGEDENE